MVAYERRRIHAEQMTIGRALVTAVAAHNFSWVEGNGGGNPFPNSTPKKGTEVQPNHRPTYTMTSKEVSTKTKSIAPGNKQQQEAFSLPDLKYSGNEVERHGCG